MNWTPLDGSLDLQTLRTLYQSRALAPSKLAEALYERLAAAQDDAIWAYRVPRTELLERARLLEENSSPGSLPLWGIPFAVKDNFDVAGLATTCACPAFAYSAPKTAFAVERWLAAGGILIGKTNLDQFATGLVGVRSPDGGCRNPFDARMIPGGSSSGSAVAVARGLVSIALASDTAGSGRVPAAFNNIVGYKPSRGLIGKTGLFPACRSLDHVSIMALTVGDALDAAQCAAGFDPADPDSDPRAGSSALRSEAPVSAGFRFGMLAVADRRFFGDAQAEACYDRALAQLIEMGGRPVEIDYAPFYEAGRLLYDGPWAAERLASVRGFLSRDPAAVLPVIRMILEQGEKFSAVEAFEAQHRLADLQRSARAAWSHIDVLALPTTGTIYSREAVAADPLRLNSNLGYYTQFANLLGCCVVAVPAGFRDDGLPFGLSLVARNGYDPNVAGLAAAFHARSGPRLGATAHRLLRSESCSTSKVAPRAGWVRLVVVGAHMRGLPLNAQLLQHEGRFIRACHTAPGYRLYALPGGPPLRPGLVRSGTTNTAIEVEVWELPLSRFGEFVAQVPPPLAIGTVALDDGESAKGFLCESIATETAQEISSFGGWRAYLAQASGDCSNPATS